MVLYVKQDVGGNNTLNLRDVSKVSCLVGMICIDVRLFCGVHQSTSFDLVGEAEKCIACIVKLDVHP